MVERAGVSILGMEGRWRLALGWREGWWRRSDGDWVVGEGEGGGSGEAGIGRGCGGG